MTEQQIARVVASDCGVDPQSVHVSATRLGGGLESEVVRAEIHVTSADCTWPRSVVIKELRGRHRRELAVYRLVEREFERPPLPPLLAVHRRRGADYLFLGDVAPLDPWPWSATSAAAVVCGALAALHRHGVSDELADDWDYERELQESADETLDVVRHARTRGLARYWRGPGDLRRVAEALPLIRDRLLRHTTLIHGDVHPGNVMLTHGHEPGVVFIDWGRARLGSPLEDVASWIHSLGAWEPQARRFHDTLLRSYLVALGREPRLDHDFRTHYSLAGACNGLAGAIRYHLLVLFDDATPEVGRVEAFRALHAWQRIIRRAAVALRTLMSPGAAA